MLRKQFYLFVFLFAPTLVSCEAVLNSWVECGIKGVELKSKTLKQATKNQSYYEFIKAGVKNDPDDELNQFSFTYTGLLPDGITASYSSNIFELKGVATETGTFPFQVTVNVRYNGDELNICNESKTQDYILTVK